MLHTNQIEVMPESGLKGRGLTDYEGRILEFQTALSVEAENDYERMEMIRARCASFDSVIIRSSYRSSVFSLKDA